MKTEDAGTSTAAPPDLSTACATSTVTYISALSSLSGLATTPRTLTVRVAGSSVSPTFSTVPSNTLSEKASQWTVNFCPDSSEGSSSSGTSTCSHSLLG